MNLEMENNRLRFYQWDTGQRLIVDDDSSCAEVHFANAETPQALVCRIREENGVRMADVPNILLQNPVSFTAYLFSHADDGTQTRYAKSFAVCRRPKPEDYVYTETQVQSYKALDERITKLENADAVDPEVIAASVDQYMARNPMSPEQIGALPADQLPKAINDALAQAKASGQFKGDPGEPGADGKTPVKGEDYFTEADVQEIAEQAAGLVESSEGSSGPAKTQKLLDVTFTEATALVSVTLEHDFHKLFLVWQGGENKRTVDAEGAAISSNKLGVILGSTNFSWNARKVGVIEDSGRAWATGTLLMEWTEDLSTYLGATSIGIGTNTPCTMYSYFGGHGALLGAGGNSDATAPVSGTEIDIVLSTGFFAPNTRIVLVGEYYE